MHLLSCTCAIAALISLASANDETVEPKLWAVLIAGSNYWQNYGDQASVYRAYQILHKHGIPDERIIMFHYDDIANNTENPFPGKVINKPGGPDVYHNVLKDYTGENVTPENFMNVLKGNATAMQGIGSGRVLQSGPNDHVFIYFNDHGDIGLLCFPNDDLTVQQLHETIMYMHKHKMYGKMVLYIDACFSGSMFDGILPTNINVFATTSANPNEEAWNCYCMVNPLDTTCIAAEYSGAWMDDAESEDVETESLQTQFNIVKKDTFRSHPMEYGDTSIGKLKLGQFVGPKETKYMPSVICPGYTTERVGNLPISLLQRKMERATNKKEYLKLQNHLDIIQLKRALVNATIEAIALEITEGDKASVDQLLARKDGRVRNMECHHKLVKAFARHCFNLGKNTFAMKFANVANNICRLGYDATLAADLIQRVCEKVLGGTV